MNRAPHNFYASRQWICVILFVLTGCGQSSKTRPPQAAPEPSKISVIFDTDANNELDDQHALAYLLMNGDVFDLKGVTVNATFNGGRIEEHYREAERILQLCNLKDSIPLKMGADGNFEDIATDFDPTAFDGIAAVDFLLDQTQNDSVLILAVGKLTNVALALKKDPTFANRTRIIWLGSNYPEPGEYNQDNDTVAVNFVLNSPIPLDMVTVRYGRDSGTDAVKVTPSTINSQMPGLGPVAIHPVLGRHGGSFNTFGDYSIDLFEHIDLHGDPPSRPLFDMVAVALLKNPSWGVPQRQQAPVLIDNVWVDRPTNPRMITIWENFDREGLLEDFFSTMKDPVLVSTSNSHE